MSVKMSGAEFKKFYEDDEFWPDGDEGPSLETYFRRWRKKQTTTFLTVECDHTKLEAVKAAIKAAGGKISK